MVLPRISSRRMHGRMAELELLQETRRALSRRRGSVVLVGGEAGLGKSRLLAEFMSGLRGGRAPLRAIGEALEDAPRPFGPFRMALGSLVAAAPQTLAAATPLVARALGTLVPDAVAQSRGEIAAPQTLEKAELFTGVLRFLEALAEKRATVIALEDLHWADSATLELLVHLAPRIAGMRVMLIATYRDAGLQPSQRLFASLARLMRERTVRSLKLEPLAATEIRALIDDALGSEYELSPQRVGDVVASSDGNPFFAEAMLARAIESERTGLVEPLPISIRALTLEGVSMLDTAERILLDYAAVLGTQFTIADLAAVADRPEDAVRVTMHRLRGMGVLLEESVPRPLLHLRHAVVRQIIYEQLPPENLRSMHASVLETLERRDRNALDALAYHAWRAELPRRALEYSERAGDAALAVRAAAQAATYYDRALTLCVDEDGRIRLLGKSGEAWLQQSDFNRAVAAYRMQHELLLARGETDAAARALTRAAAEQANGGKIREALAALEEFQVRHGSGLAPECADHLNVTIARIATAAEDFGRAARALATIPDPDGLEAFTHQVYWLAQLFVSEHALDIEGWKRAAAALQRRNPETYPLMRAQMLHSIASTAVLFGANDEGERAAGAAIALDREYGFSRPLSFANAVKASILCVRGRLVEARDCIGAALSESDLFVVRLELALGASPAALALGADALAERLLAAEFSAAIREAGMEAAASLFDGMRAALLFSRGREREARALLHQSLTGPQHPFAVVHLWPFAAEQADDEDVKRLRRLCEERAAAAKSDALVVHACLALLEREPEKAASRYHQLGWPLHEAHAIECAGRTGAALSLYQSCGSIHDVRRLSAHETVTHLSNRERQVAAMIARGLTNRAIAGELHVTEKTVEKYVTSTYAKLNFSTRAQLAAHVARNAESFSSA